MVSKIVRSAAAGLVCTLITAPAVVGQTSAIEVVGIKGKPVAVALEMRRSPIGSSSSPIVVTDVRSCPTRGRGKSSSRTTRGRRAGFAR